MVRIRPAEPRDIPSLHALILELAEYEREPDAVVATAADLERALFGGEASGTGAPALYGYVADDGGEIVGMALWFLTYSTWRGQHGIHLEDLYVTPQRRGDGIGRALLATLAAVCVERGYQRLEWSVLDWNAPAIGFYTGLQAVPMDDWTVYRLTDDALSELAAEAAGEEAAAT